jgi:hypothetical protein
MSSKNKHKKVTYKHPINENADYLVPLQYDYHSSLPIQSKLSENTSPVPPPPSGFFASIYFPISLLFYVGIPISQLVIGLIYIGQCTVQQIIVAWMIVSGIFGILLVIIGIIIHMKIRKQPFFLTSYDNPQLHPLMLRILLPFFLLILLFIVAWFFAGQVFIFEVKLRVEFFDPTLPEYCHGNLYKAAYIIIFINYLIFLLAIVLNVLSYVAPPNDNATDNHEKKKRPIDNRKT